MSDERVNAESEGSSASGEAADGCPYLGLPDQQRGGAIGPARYVCYAQRTQQRPFADVDISWRAAYCVTAAHRRCPFYCRAQDRRPAAWWQFWRRASS